MAATTSNMETHVKRTLPVPAFETKGLPLACSGGITSQRYRDIRLALPVLSLVPLNDASSKVAL